MEKEKPTLGEALVGFLLIIVVFLFTAWLESHQHLFF